MWINIHHLLVSKGSIKSTMKTVPFLQGIAVHLSYSDNFANLSLSVSKLAHLAYHLQPLPEQSYIQDLLDLLSMRIYKNQIHGIDPYADL